MARKTLADYKAEVEELTLRLTMLENHNQKDRSALAGRIDDLEHIIIGKDKKIDEIKRERDAWQRSSESLKKNNRELQDQMSKPLSEVYSVGSHASLDSLIRHFRTNTFEMRDVKSSRILALLVSARGLLKKATKK